MMGEYIRSTVKYQVASSWFFYSSAITMMYSPIKIRLLLLLSVMLLRNTLGGGPLL